MSQAAGHNMVEMRLSKHHVSTILHVNCHEAPPGKIKCAWDSNSRYRGQVQAWINQSINRMCSADLTHWAAWLEIKVKMFGNHKQLNRLTTVWFHNSTSCREQRPWAHGQPQLVLRQKTCCLFTSLHAATNICITRTDKALQGPHQLAFVACHKMSHTTKGTWWGLELLDSACNDTVTEYACALSFRQFVYQLTRSHQHPYHKHQQGAQSTHQLALTVCHKMSHTTKGTWCSLLDGTCGDIVGNLFATLYTLLEAPWWSLQCDC